MNGPRLAARLSIIAPSATLSIAKRANEMRAQGTDVISFAVGEPDFETPEHIRDAAKRAIDAGVSRYTDVRGMKSLREAICADSARRRGGVSHAPEDVVVSVGAKQSLYNVALSILDEGDEVLIPAPYWVSYPEQVRLVGATPVTLETREQDGFCVRPDVLEQAIGPRTKALILCTPSNPTGSAYTRVQLEALALVARRHSFWIVVDEIYGRLVYDGFDQRSMLEVAPDIRDRIVIVDGVSKTYAMTGWRIGWALGPRALANACDQMQGQVTSNASTVAQHAALAALVGPDDTFEVMRRAFDERRRVMLHGLTAISGVRCRTPEGAFYAFPDVRALFGKRAGGEPLASDVDVAQYLLERARVAVVPGTPFGAPGYIRLSYATSLELIREGLARIRDAVAELA